MKFSVYIYVVAKIRLWQSWMDECMRVQRWYNDAGRGGLKYWETGLSQCHFVHQKSHMDWLGIEPKFLQCWQSTT